MVNITKQISHDRFRVYPKSVLRPFIGHSFLIALAWCTRVTREGGTRTFVMRGRGASNLDLHIGWNTSPGNQLARSSKSEKRVHSSRPSLRWDMAQPQVGSAGLNRCEGDQNHRRAQIKILSPALFSEIVLYPLLSIPVPAPLSSLCAVVTSLCLALIFLLVSL